MSAIVAIPSSPPSALLPYFGPGRAGQVVPRLDLSYLMQPLGDDGSGPSGGWIGVALVISAGAAALAAIALINEHKHHPRRRR